MATGDLTTLVEVKEYLGTKTNNDDSLLSKLISRASSFICNYASTSFLQANYTEQRDGNDSMRLMMRNLPVTNVSSLVINGQNVLPGGNSQKTGFWFDDRFNRGMSNISIAYTAGYATIPIDVEMTCIEIVASKYKRKDRVGKTSEGMAGQQTNYTTSDLNTEQKNTLNSYKRVGLA